MQIGCHPPTQGPVATREALTTRCSTRSIRLNSRYGSS